VKSGKPSLNNNNKFVIGNFTRALSMLLEALALICEC
jgi:hypothetical protein